MNKGRVLKVRMGHEANCSSDMAATFIVILSSITYVPIAMLTAGEQAAKLGRTPEKDERVWCLIVPQVLGLILAVIFALMAAQYSPCLAPLVLIIEVPFALAIYLGYRQAPRLRWWTNLVVPLITAAGIAAYYLFFNWPAS